MTIISLKSHEKISLILKHYIYIIIRINRNSLTILFNQIFSTKNIFPLTAVKKLVI